MRKINTPETPGVFKTIPLLLASSCLVHSKNFRVTYTKGSSKFSVFDEGSSMIYGSDPYEELIASTKSQAIHM
jgi:hypothetical protein